MMKRLLPLLLLLVAVVQSTQAQEPEPYAVLSDDNTKLTFYYDTNKESRNGLSVGPFGGWNQRGWNNVVSSIITVVFDSSVFYCTSITSTAYWFHDCCNLTTVTGIENFNTSNVTSMAYMFCGCSGLTSLNLSNFDTSNVTSMDHMFSECSSLTSLDVSHFDTSNVTDMGYMFYICSSLTSLDVSHFDTSNVTDMGMSYMFSSCSSLTSLDVSSFNTSKVTSMSGMFSGCSCLTSLDVSNFDTANVTVMSSMFGYCPCLTSLDVCNFNTANVARMDWMFQECSALETLDLSSFNTAMVTDMWGMFCNCTSLKTLDVSSFDTGNVINMESMFYRCSSLTSLDLSHFDTSNAASVYFMFDSCSNLKSLTIGKNMTKIGYGPFYGCSNLNDVYCYVDLKNLTWEGSDDSDCFKPQKGTLFHVYKKSDWEEKFPNANVTFVGDLRQKANTNAIIRGSETEYWSSFYDSSENFKADEGIKVYIVKIVGDALVLEQVADRIINKGQGVLLKSTTENVSLAYSEAESSADYSGNSLLGTDVEITNPGNAYVLNSKTAGLGFYKLSATGKILANKAYLVNNSGDARSFMAFDDETVTGIKSVEQSRLSSDGVFNLKGQRVSHPSKGLYVVNGKKVMIK